MNENCLNVSASDQTTRDVIAALKVNFWMCSTFCLSKSTCEVPKRPKKYTEVSIFAITDLCEPLKLFTCHENFSKMYIFGMN